VGFSGYYGLHKGLVGNVNQEINPIEKSKVFFHGQTTLNHLQKKFELRWIDKIFINQSAVGFIDNPDVIVTHCIHITKIRKKTLPKKIILECFV
jgi:hypothetical protein